MKINFYVGKSSQLRSRLLFACKLVEKALAQQLSCYIYLNSLRDCEYMDDLLWTFNDISFIPHSIYSGQETLSVLLGYGDNPPPPNTDFLINLSLQTPIFLSDFKHVAEVLDQEVKILQAGRKRYVDYRKQGYTLNYYQL